MATPKTDERQVDVKRSLFFGIGLFVWIVAVLSLAIWASAGTPGENAGKLCGTIGSALAFGPPAVLVTRWYKAQAARSAEAVRQMHARAPRNEQPASGSRSDDADRLGG